MNRIGVVIHGPAVIDSGRAQQVLGKLSGIGTVEAVLGGTMGRAAVIDAGLEDVIDISSNYKPSESILNISRNSDSILLVNEGKSARTGLAFGRQVYDKLRPLAVPLFQVEFGNADDTGCSIIQWTENRHPFLFELCNLLGGKIIQQPDGCGSIEVEGGTVRRRLAGVRPGEYVTVNGIVIGKARSDDVIIVSEDGRITGLEGGRLKPHGVEKLEHVDLASAIVRSGVLRDAVVEPGMLERPAPGCAVIIDHSAEDTFEIARNAEMAVVIGDDTTAVAGDLLTRLCIPMIGITDGDRDGITRHTHVPPGSVVIRLAPGNDDIVGRRVREEIFGGRGRTEMGDGGFEGVLERVLGVAGGLVEEVVRY